MSEFEAMLEEVKKRRPERILEIGTARGATLLGWCQIAQKQVISIDLEGGIHGGGYLPVRKKLYQEFKINNEGIDLYMLQKNSQINETVAEVRSLLKGQLLDVLFIDGDHRYAGIKKDFELWSPLVRSGGVILFHDIARHTRTAECEVDVFWNEIKTGYENIEWIENAQQGWAGIGMLVKP
jgi:predicted O-methyltransferase YrrM